jgi:hypothetical protein
MYRGHEGSFDNTPLGAKVGLEKTENGFVFVVPHETIEDARGQIALQTKYTEMWQNIKLAADETGASEKLHIRFAD